MNVNSPAAAQGLPEQWSALLQVSGISKTELAQNPQGMLDVLEFYTDAQKPGTGFAATDKDDSKFMKKTAPPPIPPPPAQFAAPAPHAPATAAGGPALPPPPPPPRPAFTKSEKTVPIAPKPAEPVAAAALPPPPPPPAAAAAATEDPSVQKRDKDPKKKMSDAEVMARLREIVSPASHRDKYVNLNKIGQGCVHGWERQSVPSFSWIFLRQSPAARRAWCTRRRTRRRARRWR